jgi:PAS domain-containing protein
VIVTAMAAGSATTLAAIPAAAMSFVIASIVPFAVYFAAKNEQAYVFLALLALCFTVAMVAAARQLHGTFLAAVGARLENAKILERFYAERQDWLEVSETTDAFALLDPGEKLLLWNQNLAAFLSIPPGSLVRGASFRELLRRGAAPIDRPSPEAGDGWIETFLPAAVEGDAAEPVAREFDNGLWLRARARRTARGHVTVVFADVTALKLSEQTILQREAALAEARRPGLRPGAVS